MESHGNNRHEAMFFEKNEGTITVPRDSHCSCSPSVWHSSIFTVENSAEGLKPNMCKWVSVEKTEDEDDYPKDMLRNRALSIG
jgi:hypothetical protein